VSQHQNKARRKKHVRWSLAALSAVLSAGVIFWATYRTLGIPNPKLLKELPYNEATKAAVELRVQHIKDVFEMAVVALGALWALVIAKKDEARIAFGDYPELSMLLCASASLLLSVLWHEFYLERLTYFYYVGATTCFSGAEKCLPDVFQSTPLNTLYTFQLTFLMLGGMQALATLVSAHRLKER
jgi:hypothetical protein